MNHGGVRRKCGTRILCAKLHAFNDTTRRSPFGSCSRVAQSKTAFLSICFSHRFGQPLKNMPNRGIFFYALVQLPALKKKQSCDCSFWWRICKLKRIREEPIDHANACISSRCNRAYHQFDRIAYHQTEADLFMHGKAVMIYSAAGADDIQAQALDDIPNLASLRFG